MTTVSPMSEQRTFANPTVLEFYKELPFNYRESVDEQAQAVRSHDGVAAYPVLTKLLQPHTRVLDVGCGAGWLSNSIACHYRSKVTGIDFNPVAVERARAVAGVLGLSTAFHVADLFLFSPDQLADVVVSLGVLHHTNNCHAAIRRIFNHFVRRGGHAFIGLYHAFGRRPFLEYFQNMREGGASEEEMFQRYRELMPQATDEIHARSWFRDQVLHPHETQHTLAEMMPLFDECGMHLLSTSINRFGPIGDTARLLDEEKEYEALSRKRLGEGRYFPGFFVFLVKRREEITANGSA